MKIVSVNIEHEKHVERVKNFLVEESPDILCVQELCEKDVEFFSGVTGLQAIYIPMCKSPKGDDVWGIAIFADSIISYQSHRIGGSQEDVLHPFDNSSREKGYTSTIFYLLVAEIAYNDQIFTIGTTHLPATEKGEINNFQREAVSGLLKETAQYDDLIVCGDFNAPRGKEIFSTISNLYQDNIPAEYLTSIDANLHRAGHVPFMVDGMFSTPHYRFSAVELKDGVSDHMAVVGEVSKV